MRKAAFAAAVALLVCCTSLAAPKSDPPPPWAFIPMHEESGPPATSKLITVPGSGLHFTETMLDDPFAGADWFPEDHPAMPEVVAHGRRPHLWACSYCHGATGVGDPASAALAGLSAGYIEQQLAEFSSGRRRCAVAHTACGLAMPSVASLLSAADAKVAATYFSQLPYHSRVHVVEAAMVPRTRYGSLYPISLASGGEQPLGMRILEMPDNSGLEEEGDRAAVTAYVPPGSIALGKKLVASGAGALPCASCHGAGLQGAGMVPPLAGRLPTYIVRQLYDIQYGYRAGPAVAPMEPEVTHLSARDRIAIAAYLASLAPIPAIMASSR